MLFCKKTVSAPLLNQELILIELDALKEIIADAIHVSIRCSRLGRNGIESIGYFRIHRHASYCNGKRREPGGESNVQGTFRHDIGIPINLYFKGGSKGGAVQGDCGASFGQMRDGGGITWIMNKGAFWFVLYKIPIFHSTRHQFKEGALTTGCVHSCHLLGEMLQSS
jgi:hypothetical protein